MIRLIGILTGSAIAIAGLIVALGLPQFDVPQPEASNITEATTQVAHTPLPELQPEIAPPAEPELEPEPEPRAEPEPVAAATPDALADIPSLPIPSVAETPEPGASQWYAFWSPFRSEIAADGFVSQLQRTTGLDYRVVKVKPGVYEVAFAYSDDSDIDDKLAQISSATGLDLSGG